MRHVAGAKIEASYPLAAALLFAVAALCVPVRNRWRTAILVIPPVVSLIFWFLTAPDIRFAQGSLLLLPIACALVLLTRVQRAGLAAIVFVIANVHTGYYVLLHRREIARVSTSGWQPVTRAVLSTRTTASGLTVYVPQKGQCWDSPLPCTPYFDARLALREPPDFRHGFKLDE